ncbi:unnamed protein product [Staurois parvus]|uniref:Uncharacterized protein n=1 Tax=Staurois parvus TaxID=386267 RepID=A0ABN9H157_9NEOB|nr:unnamed protein product [Staurois parvus]
MSELCTPYSFMWGIQRSIIFNHLPSRGFTPLNDQASFCYLVLH